MESREWLNDQTLGKEVSSNTEPKLADEEVSRQKKEASEFIPASLRSDKLIQEILERIENSENVYCEVGWKKIYTIDLLKISQERGCDLENAFYLLFYWMTKIEHEKVREKQLQKEELSNAKKKLAATEKVPWRIKEGNKYISKEKQEARKKFVEGEASNWDNYWNLVENVLKLLKMIDNWEPWEEIQKTFDNQENSELGYSITLNRVVYFSKKWEEAEKKLNKYDL